VLANLRMQPTGFASLRPARLRLMRVAFGEKDARIESAF